MLKSVKGCHLKQQIYPCKFMFICFLKRCLHLIQNFVSSTIFSYLFTFCIKKFLTHCGWTIQGIEVSVALKQNPDISPKIDIHLQPNITPFTVLHHTPYMGLIHLDQGGIDVCTPCSTKIKLLEISWSGSHMTCSCHHNWVVLLCPYLCIRGVYLSSINYNQSRRVYINQRHKHISLIWS